MYDMSGVDDRQLRTSPCLSHLFHGALPDGSAAGASHDESWTGHRAPVASEPSFESRENFVEVVDVHAQTNGSVFVIDQ